MAPRLIRVARVPNVRDLGGRVTEDGRRVRQGLLFRSAGLNDNAYVKDGKNDWPAKIQEKLEALEESGRIDLTHTNNREFDDQTGYVRWQWLVIMWGELTWTETVEAPAGE